MQIYRLDVIPQSFNRTKTCTSIYKNVYDIRWCTLSILENCLTNSKLCDGKP